MIFVYRWFDSHQTAENLTPDAFRARLPELHKEAALVWIDLSNPTLEEEQVVFESFLRVHHLTLEDITRLRREPDAPPHFPKVEEFSDYLFVIVNPLSVNYLQGVLQKETEQILVDKTITQLSAVLTTSVLITHHHEAMACIRDIQDFLERHERQGQRGPDYVFHLILDATVDQFAHVLDHFDDTLDALEPEVLKQPREALFQRMLRLKREIVVLRKTLIFAREVLVRLARGEFTLVDERETAYYRNVYDHLVRFTELIESAREMVTDLLQSYLAATSNRLNSIMKVLAMISTIILPMTLISGIYGMNFEWMPGLKESWGFPFSLGLMAATALGALVYFKWAKWL